MFVDFWSGRCNTRCNTIRIRSSRALPRDYSGTTSASRTGVTATISAYVQPRRSPRTTQTALGKAIAALEGVTSDRSAPRSGRPGISAAGRQRIAAAQRARWAKIKGRKVVSITHKRTMSPAARRKIAAAQKARWAKWRKAERSS
jgi:hypothetical protein